MRKISLDTETTGLLFYDKHRIIEIGCVEILNEEITTHTFHKYINPERPIDNEAKKITGLTNEFLNDKPKFNDIIDEFFNFLSGSDEIIIHNANFDINFINNELQINFYKIKNLESKFKVFDTLNFARKMYPGKKNNLDALCERFNIKNIERTHHSALKDAELLAHVYLKMKKEIKIEYKNENLQFKKRSNFEKNFKTLKSSDSELNTHLNYIDKLKKNDK